MPHPVDEFLDQHNYYRKITAINSSSLFCVISEQMYDTQNYHPIIRQRCVGYMKKKSSYFKKYISGDFADYLKKMADPNTHGTVIELRAMALMFGRNVIIFKKFSLGKYFLRRQYFQKTFMIFQWSHDSFHTIISKNTLADLSICQSICYEILYKKVFQYPDIDLAVEKSLRSRASNLKDKYEVQYQQNRYAQRIYFFGNCRSIKLSGPQETQCISKNAEYCHFHTSDCKQFCKTLQRNLPRNQSLIFLSKFNSCMFQLIMQGHRPLPHKVALGLKADAYYNIEFDYYHNYGFSKINTSRNFVSSSASNLHQKPYTALRYAFDNMKLFQCECRNILMELKNENINERIILPEYPIEQNQNQDEEKDYEFCNEHFITCTILYFLTLISYLWEYFV